MIDYEVGTIPSRPLTLLVKDELDNSVNVVGYENWYIEMLDSNDQKVDMTGVEIRDIPQALGAFSVSWPKNRVIFNEKGEYVLRLVLESIDGSRDITRVAQINVREFGRMK